MCTMRCSSNNPQSTGSRRFRNLAPRRKVRFLPPEGRGGSRRRSRGTAAVRATNRRMGEEKIVSTRERTEPRRRRGRGNQPVCRFVREMGWALEMRRIIESGPLTYQFWAYRPICDQSLAKLHTRFRVQFISLSHTAIANAV